MISHFKRIFVEPWRRRAFQPELEKATPILVYQMGKVASTSIHRSLEVIHPGWVIQIHEYEPNRYTKRKLKRRMVFEWAREHGKPVDVITLTREPVGRNVACLFENFVQWTGKSWSDPDITVGSLRKYFMEELDQDFPLRWFDDNIKAHFGIDCYEKPFAPQGHQTYAKDSVRVLAMQSELPDGRKRTLIEEFLGLDRLELVQANVGSEKPYSDLYREFKETVRFPESYLKRMCGSRYFQHFYRQDVIDEVYDRWIER